MNLNTITTRRGSRVAALLTFGSAAIAAVAVTVAVDGVVAAVGVGTIGILLLLGLKSLFEVAVAQHQLSAKMATALNTLGERHGEVLTGIDAALTTLTEQHNRLAAEVRATTAETSNGRAALSEVASDVTAVSDALTELASTANDLAAQVANTSGSRLDLLVQASEHHARSIEQLRADVRSVVDQIGIERRALLAASEDSPSGLQTGPAAPSPRTILQLIEAVDAGAIPPERISDNFGSEVIGLSGRKFRTLVCELVGAFGEIGAYVEIGTYRGRTICTSATSNPQARHIGVDNFSQVDKDGLNQQIFKNLIRRLSLDNVQFFDRDFEDWLAERTLRGVRDIAVYYFDASHDHRSQLIALAHGARQVVFGGVMIVDDCNYSHVRAASYDFCDMNPDWALLYERYTEAHPLDAPKPIRSEMEEGWWNGVHVLIHDPRQLVERLERQPDRELREFFLQQHRSEHCTTTGVASRSARIGRS